MIILQIVALAAAWVISFFCADACRKLYKESKEDQRKELETKIKNICLSTIQPTNDRTSALEKEVFGQDKTPGKTSYIWDTERSLSEKIENTDHRLSVQISAINSTLERIFSKKKIKP